MLPVPRAGTPTRRAHSPETVPWLEPTGLSTRTEVTDLSGRGVGLGAVRQACRRLGGEPRVSSVRGAGTRFVFTQPDRVPGEVAVAAE